MKFQKSENKKRENVEALYERLKILTLASRRKVLMERKVVGVVCCCVFIAYCIECPTQSLLLTYLLRSQNA